MSYMIPNSNDIFPRNFFTFCEKRGICDSVYAIETFTNGFNKHTTCSKILHTSW